MQEAHVLVVDDDPRVLKALVRCLRLIGITSIGALTLDEARSAIANGGVTAVLLDCRMQASRVEDFVGLFEELAPDLVANLVLMTGATSAPDFELPVVFKPLGRAEFVQLKAWWGRGEVETTHAA